jgi:1,2-diacylglycerol 3-beta-glucosyltransferase
LTEDLDLTISLAVEGWITRTTPLASVDQQGLTQWRALRKQRTRWYQGHMMTVKRLPEVWSSRKIGHAQALEIAAYLLVPWLMDLPWSILFHLCLLSTILNADSLFVFAGHSASNVVVAIVVYLLAFTPALFTSITYRRRVPGVPWLTALGYGHSFLFMNYLSFACAWASLLRIVRREHGWTKTRRELEPVPVRAALPAGPSLSPVQTSEER